MHHYPHHIGDYRSATAHLSNEEDLAYRRLLEMYYDTEKPIPLETDWVSRRLRIGSESVLSVLQDFFQRTEAGWVHDRCEQEIAQYRKRADLARENGRFGGRPKNPAGSHPVAAGGRPVTGSKANQEPITKNQELEPVTKNQEPSSSEIRDSVSDEIQGASAPRVVRPKGYSEDFEEAWSLYPRRNGSNSKAYAFTAWKARLKEGIEAESLIDGVRRYAAYCRASVTDARYIQQASTFFGPGRHFENDWAVTKQAIPSFAKQALIEAHNEAVLNQLLESEGL